MRGLSSALTGYIVLLALTKQATALLDPIPRPLPPISLPDLPILPTNSISPPTNKSCTGCVFEAEMSTTLSYPYDVHTATSTVSIVPHITIYPNTTITSYSTLTPNATVFGVNSTATGEALADLSTELTWTWSGATLTYPTVYIGYDPRGLLGGVATPTATPAFCQESSDFLFSGNSSLAYSNFAYPTDMPNGIPPPVQTAPPGGAAILKRFVSGAGTVQDVMPELLSYLETLPEISSIYSGHNLHTCTQPATQAPHNVGQGVPPAGNTFTVTAVNSKTSVLVMQTATQAPIVKTANAPAPPPQQQQQNNPPAVIPIAPAIPPPPPTADNKNAVPAPVIPAPVVPALIVPAPVVPAPVVPAPSVPAPGKPTPAPVAGLGALGNAIVSALGVPSTPAKPAQAGITPAPIGPPTLSIAGQKVTANSAGQFVVAPGTTLTPGGPAQVIAGSTISIGFSPAGSTIAVINGQTSTLSGALPIFAAAPALTIGGTTFAASVSAGSTFYVVDGTTLTQGQAATVHGTTLSLASGGDVLVINGVASFIPKATASIQYFEGAALRGRVGWAASALAVVALMFGVVM